MLFEVEKQHHGEPATNSFWAPNWILATTIKNKMRLPAECADPRGGFGRGQKALKPKIFYLSVSQRVRDSAFHSVPSLRLARLAPPFGGRRIQSLRAFRRPLYFCFLIFVVIVIHDFIISVVFFLSCLLLL